MSSKCKICGRYWTDHDGIQVTCERAQEQAAEIERLKAEIERLHKIERDRFDFWANELLNLHPAMQLRMQFCKTCGNKRCPAAGDERYKCTCSNEPGQVGEVKK